MKNENRTFISLRVARATGCPCPKDRKFGDGEKSDPVEASEVCGQL